MEKLMSTIYSFLEKDRRSHGSDHEILREHRQRRADEERGRVEARRLKMADLCSPFSDPTARIRLWEQVHGLRLPTSPTHPVLRVIAAATDLTLAHVLAEQQLRSARTAAVTT
jgi:hypothetical protein